MRRAAATIVLVAVSLAATISAEKQSIAAKPRRAPNIVLVLADDLGWSDLGCYGGEIPTPNIDSLAQTGLRFAKFYNNAVCGPTRASLLTGLYCQQIGHSGAHWNEPTDFSKCVTIAELLRGAGYRTMMVGKWQERDLPSRRGFDRFFGPMCQSKISYFHEVEHVIDIMTTCLDVAGVPYPAEFDGRKPIPLAGKSLLPIFRGRQRQGHEALYWSVPQHHVVRMDRWKAIRPRSGRELQLYDVEAHGSETVDQATRQPERASELSARLDARLRGLEAQ